MVRGKEYRGELCCLGEQVWARDMTPAADNAKLQVRWNRGLWLGKIDVSDEHLVSSGAKLLKTRTVRRLPDAEGPDCRWDRSAVTALAATPWSGREGSMQDASRSARRRYITRGDRERHEGEPDPPGPGKSHEPSRVMRT